MTGLHGSNKMTEKEYILLSNRVNISRARDILREVLRGKKYGVSIADFLCVNRKLAKIETELFNRYKSTGKYTLDNKAVYTVKLDKEINDLNDLLGGAFIDDEPVYVIAVEAFMHMPPWKKGEDVGLMISNPGHI